MQVYTAIGRKKRLFASLPTGTGKSAAVLYPAFKALGEGKTGKLAYLTARNTARQSPLNALERFYAAGMHARCMVLTAKETLCPAPTRCHPDFCPRAKGHYARQGKAIEELLCENETWTDEKIIRAADAHGLCPFELALALSELADVILMDLNYAFGSLRAAQAAVSGARKPHAAGGRGAPYGGARAGKPLRHAGQPRGWRSCARNTERLREGQTPTIVR